MIAGFAGLLFGRSCLGLAGETASAHALPFSAQAGSYPYLLVVVLFATLDRKSTRLNSSHRT